MLHVIIETFFYAKESFGELQKEGLWHKSKMKSQYDEDGNMTELTSYNADGELDEKTKYQI